jgi:purine-binding chemotaxis protein CheW
MQCLTFVLGGESFALGILGIREIIEYGEPTRLPMMPDCIRGVINLRGRSVPVMDLAVRFGRSPKETDKRTCIVIVDVMVRGEPHIIGIVVDAVSEVVEIATAEIEQAPAFAANVRADFIQGLAKVRGKFVILIDVHRVLELDEAGNALQSATILAAASAAV